MRCIVAGDLDSGFLEQRTREVLDRFDGEEGLAFTYIFHADDSACSDLADRLGVDDRDDFIDHCRKDHSSSFRSGDDEYLAIRVRDDFLQTDAAAARGLIAHELVHTVQRDTGIEETIEQTGAAYAEDVPERFAEHGIGEDAAMQFVQTVLTTAVFCLKDIFSNELLIEQGFGPDLEQYYSQVLGLEDFCPMPSFYTDNETLDQVNEAIQFELEVVPAWLPFAGHDEDRYGQMRERIRECYEENIPLSDDRAAAYEQVYRDRSGEPEAFIQAFLDTVTDHWLEKAATVRS